MVWQQYFMYLFQLMLTFTSSSKNAKKTKNYISKTLTKIKMKMQSVQINFKISFQINKNFKSLSMILKYHLWKHLHLFS